MGAMHDRDFRTIGAKRSAQPVKSFVEVLVGLRKSPTDVNGTDVEKGAGHRHALWPERLLSDREHLFETFSGTGYA